MPIIHVPLRSAMIDQDGNLSRTWLLFFQGLGAGNFDELAVSGAAAVGSLTVGGAIVTPVTPGAHTIPLAKLTGGGANGSITWNANGFVTSWVDPT